MVLMVKYLENIIKNIKIIIKIHETDDMKML